MSNWRVIIAAIAVSITLFAGVVALAREVSRNGSKIESFEVWRAEYAKDFREMRKEVKDIWRYIYEGD